MASNALGQFQVYPRAFLGKPLGPIVEKPTRPFYDQRNGLNFDMNIFDAQGVKMPFNKDIENNYQALTRHQKKTRVMAFRESILQTALTAFGTKDFYSWYRVQRFSPLFGQLHQEFLEDTIRFIVEGKRDYSLDTWLSLLTGAGADDETKKPEIPLVKTFFALDNMDRPLPGTAVNVSLKTVLQQWVSQPYGFDDLAFSLRILFGALN